MFDESGLVKYRNLQKLTVAGSSSRSIVRESQTNRTVSM